MISDLSSPACCLIKSDLHQSRPCLDIGYQRKARNAGVSIAVLDTILKAVEILDNKTQLERRKRNVNTNYEMDMTPLQMAVCM